MRMAGGGVSASPAAMVSTSSPRPCATAAAASALATLCRPGTRRRTGAARPATSSVKAMPSSPRSRSRARPHLAHSAELDAPAREGGGGAHHSLVVRVHGDGRVARHAGEELALRRRHAVDGSEAFEMGGSDVGDHADIRRRDLGETRDLAEGVHPHLEHRDRLVAGQAQQGEGQADQVVLVAVRAEDRGARRRETSLAADGGHHFLGRRLSVAAGDPDHAQGVAAARGRRQVAERTQPIGDDQGAARIDAGRNPLHQSGARSGAQGVRDEAVGVVMLAAQGDEERAGPDAARIDAHRVEELVARRLRAGDGSGGRHNLLSGPAHA